MNQCLIKQSGGLGDVIFLQKAIDYFARDFQVIHPVLPQILESAQRIKSKAHFISSEDKRLEGSPLLTDINRPAKIGNDIYIPFEKASETVPGCVIRAKYKLVGLSVDNWQESFEFSRNPEKESQLEQFLNLPAEYNLINRNFGTWPGTYCKSEVKSNTSLPNIDMTFIPGFDVFDWAGVAEKATNIFTVDTSILMICEKLNLRAEKLEMWARWGTYESIDGLFNKKWNYN